MLAEKQDAPSLLWSDWTVVETIDESIDIDGVALRRAGISAKSSRGHVVTGSAAEFDRTALRRAEYELIERASLFDAMFGEPKSRVVRRLDGTPCRIVSHDDLFLTSEEPERWQPSRSNGVALGPDWSSACRSAMLELVERDRLLRSWAGEGVPVRVDLENPLLSRFASYDWQTFRVTLDDGWSDTIEVAIVLGFPRHAGAPLVRGSGADETIERAAARAARECLQGLAFLWGEEIPSEPPAPSPTPLYHLDHFLWSGAHALLREWLSGKHSGLAAGKLRSRDDPSVKWVDLTPVDMQGRLCVAQARCEAALPLFFGEGPAWWRSAMPRAMWAHPIA
jgi:hypothetical protein